STASLTQDYTCGTLGEITFTAATGGTPGTSGYTYGVNGVYGPGLVYGNLTEGTYDLTVQDGNGCTEVVDTIIIDPLPVIPDFTDAVTYNCDGTGNITLTPPALPALTYSYSIDGGAVQTGNVFTDQTIGSHTITVTAPRACPRDFVVNVASGEAFDAAITGSTDVTCNGGTNGTITFEVTNFTGSYEYSVNGGGFVTSSNATETITGLDNIAYTINVRPDASSPAACTITLGPITLNEPTAVAASAVITKEVTCTAPTGATIEVTGSGGTPGYTYSIDGGAFQASSTFTGIAAGAHNVVVRDANNCDSPAFAITVDPAANIVFTSVPTVCYAGGNTGEIVVNVTAGNGDYQFILNGGSPQTPTPSTATTYTFTGLSNGNYTIDVVDGAGCAGTQQSVTINEQLTATA
ncbi:SprB repeat-containing protein, partial [Tenacibaculum adriaticum]|uniref:SprB repeat-containing protein n=1 Tax=Tenacibaculum adriaticum TaxID=413713 RepID=UPI001FE65188